MSHLFLTGDAPPDPSPAVVARRLRLATPVRRRAMSRQSVIAVFGLTDEEFDGLKDRGEIKTSTQNYRYDEERVARALNWHGPMLPSEVAWLRGIQSKPETLHELQAVYYSNPDEWVYRCYHGAELVYVGVTRAGMNRIRNHMESAEWMRHVTCIEVEHFTTREQSERREAELIARFEPRFNRSRGNVSLLKDAP